MMLLYVGLGGALGAMARYGVTLGAEKWLGEQFPFGTLFVNLGGCLLMGILAGLGEHWLADSPQRAFWIVGVLGGFTTFSAFSMDIIALYQRQLAPEALIYLGATVILSLLLLVLGMVLTRQALGTL